MSALLEAVDLVKDYRLRGMRRHGGSRRSLLRAVDGVNLAIPAGRTVALVGESGSGKSTTARMILGIEQPTSGTVRHDGIDIADLDRAGRRAFRRSVQAVFQDPYSSLDPRMRVWSIISEPLRNFERLSRSDHRARAAELLEVVGLDERRLDAFPRDFSGGQRQRIALARALALEPRLIVLDEPISSLDVSIGAQIMNLLRDLQEDTGTAYLLIAHDLATVRHLAHEVAVMYRGRIVEVGAAEAVFQDPLHPYTRLLLDSARLQSTDLEDEATTHEVDLPLASDSEGCPFAARCPEVMAHCWTDPPQLRTTRSCQVACHLYEPDDDGPIARGRDRSRATTEAAP